MNFSFFTDFFRKRQQEIEDLSHELSMNFRLRDYSGIQDRFRHFELFRRGYGKKVRNVLYDNDSWQGAEVWIFDYQYVIGGGNSTRRISQSVFLIQSDTLNVPQLLLKPENVFHRIGTFLGKQDIDFEEFPVFSKQYLLKGPNENWIRQTINEDLLHFFTIERNWTLEGYDNHLIFYRAGHRMRPKAIREFYEKGLTVYDFISKNYGGEMV